ncbi:MAG: peptidoglycan DD-metalloendopeptidase family protein [Gammaproteobacteria bacterium]|jgi:murein DD-endopeptidase MepM/ murein hydrolase activator NlpD|nr:peptidoglycan DD-metalloendopeptidase family protein [Gammaproteobacteria bacterium]
MNNKLFNFCILWACLGFYPSFALSESIPGGVAIIAVNDETRPQVFYEDKKVMVIGNPGAWQAVVGINLNAKPGLHQILIKSSQANKSLQFTVIEKQYKTQHINIKNKRKVNPNKLDMERINREKKLIETVKSNWRNIELDSLDLILPVQGRYSSPFGLRRFFNQQARKPHGGIDIAAAEGTPIKAATAGIITNTGNYFFNGNTVFIDHGQGMITMYCHMNNIEVSEGEKINKGDIIGSVGQTGRVTGPHLHWSVILNQTTVNPEFFMSSVDTETEH